MKKNICFSLVTVVLTIMVCSCGPEEAKKEVIIVPVQTQPDKEKEPAKKSTTITVNKNGVKVEAKKVDVTIKKQ